VAVNTRWQKARHGGRRRRTSYRPGGVVVEGDRGVEAAQRYSSGGGGAAELGLAALGDEMGDVDGARGRRSSAPTARWGEVLGDCGGGEQEARWEQGTTAVRRRSRKPPSVGEGGRKKGDIGVGVFCPGWSHDPGQKALLSPVVASP